jgi:hypothetical protein
MFTKWRSSEGSAARPLISVRQEKVAPFPFAEPFISSRVSWRASALQGGARRRQSAGPWRFAVCCHRSQRCLPKLHSVDPAASGLPGSSTCFEPTARRRRAKGYMAVSAPRATVHRASPRSGRWSAFASSHGPARIQSFRPSGSLKSHCLGSDRFYATLGKSSGSPNRGEGRGLGLGGGSSVNVNQTTSSSRSRGSAPVCFLSASCCGSR